jgi:16S rRNA (guanine527-N7)-methyltransferase
VTEAPASPEVDSPEIRAAIEAMFADRAPVAASYAEFLTTAGIERGMLGPREAERVWERHLLNSAAIAPLLPHAATVVDLGSGAGLPGIPLAIARPDLRIVLLEPLQRRVRFLTDCLVRLALPGVVIHHGRAEQGIAAPADVVVARAVASFDKLLRLSRPLLHTRGMLLAIKGENAAREVHDRAADMPQHAKPEILTMPAPGRPVTVIRVEGIGVHSGGTGDR